MTEESATTLGGSLTSDLNLRPNDNQVAGHTFSEGRLGTLVDDAGRFYKPVQDGERGSREEEFYTRLSRDAALPPHIRRFFPGFFGVADVPVEGGGTCKHLILEDVTAGYCCPCVIDIKIGHKTWYPGATEKYIQKCLAKDASTTSGELGFRVSGMQVWSAHHPSPWKASRSWCKGITAATADGVLLRFASASAAVDVDGAEVTRAGPAGLPEEVLGGSAGAIAQLQELASWFEEQTNYHFYSTSILISYEGQSEAASRAVRVRLVDFSHTRHDQEARDDNFRAGLGSLIARLERIRGTS